MMKKAIFYLFLSIIITSCASEKFNVSPLENALSTGVERKSSLEDDLRKSMANNLNASEITNLIATFPRFKKEEVNQEVSKLKTSLQNYLYAYEAYNLAGKKRHLKEVQNSYKKLQKLRKYLNADEDEVMNRYLVRIKTNMGILENATVVTK